MKKIFPIVLISLLVAVAVFGAGMYVQHNSTSGSSSTLSLAGSTSVQPDAQALAAAYMANNSSVTVNVVGGGTAAGLRPPVRALRRSVWLQPMLRLVS